MRARLFFARGLGTLRRRVGAAGRVSCLVSLIVGVAAVVPASAGAWNEDNTAPQYSLSVVEGETTQPEHSVIATSGSVEPEASVAVSIIRGGLEVSRSSGMGNAWMASIPAPGDTVNLESPTGPHGHPGGKIVGSFVYDGLPSIDPTVCAGSANFSGQRSPGQTVQGGYFWDVTGPYGNFERGNPGQAQITLLSGSAFGGSFLTPLAHGETVWARESLETPLAGGAVFTYSSENDRPVGACPAPPPPPPPPPLPPALQGLLKLTRTTIHKLLKSGWLDQVTINQPGTIVQDLYLQDGKLPAFAAANKGKHHARKVPPAQLVARGSATATHPGTVNVLIRVTAKGRRLLRHRSKVRLVLVTTLRSNTGAKLSLARRTVTLKH
jgi:hypothetical protein